MNERSRPAEEALTQGAPLFTFDAYSPQEVAELVRKSGVKKAGLPLLSQIMLAMLGGAFIGLGALYYVVVRSDPTLGFAARQVLGGGVFSVGLIMVVVAGAELFTGNNLLVMARAHGLISTSQVLRNWTIVLFGNLVGAIGLAVLVYLAGHAAMNDGAVGQAYLSVAAGKAALPFWNAFFRGVLCNALVCLGIWMSMAGRSVVDKVIVLVFPISAFIAAGFEHSVANLYFFSMALLLAPAPDAAMAAGMAHNLAAVVLGNAVGGGVLVGMVYYLIYVRGLATR
ncbi:MAG: formate/nitrite transporter family protein [Lysobacteraceae bacterium]|nr:MAG: formate/nitrite transporter family protein [Xanthomonadaceae bacterium]